MRHIRKLERLSLSGHAPGILVMPLNPQVIFLNLVLFEREIQWSLTARGPAPNCGSYYVAH